MDKKFLRLTEPAMPFYFAAFALLAGAGYFFNLWLGVAGTALFLLTLLIYFIVRARRRRRFARFLETSLLNSDTLSSRSMLTFPLPMTVLRAGSGEVIWCNQSFKELAGESGQIFQVRLDALIPGFELRWLAGGDAICPYDINFRNRIFTLYGASFDEKTETGEKEEMVILYWQDKTELLTLKRGIEDKNVICAEIVFDNYDEAMSSFSDSRKSEIQAAVERELSAWAAPAGGILRKVDRDRFFFVFEEKYFKIFAEDKFSIRKMLQQNPVTQEAAATLSIGIGRDGDTLRDNMENARLALDMALSRGGDQVVVRSRLSFDFYGSGGSEYEKRTKVKARIMANVLGGLIRDCSGLYVMGHSYADNDALGAAVGMVCAGRKYGKRTRIIIDRNNNNVGPMLQMLDKNEEYKDVFITPEEALVESSATSLLVVVDTNRPQYVESTPVLESFMRVAVIDHHRRAADYIENAAVNIHEPSASSACEIVVELLQYLVKPGEILKCEAVAMLAGITLDTKSFTLKTGVRTFDAASFLRRIGADMVEVKLLFQNDFSNYLKRGELIRHTVFYERAFAIVTSPEEVDNTVAAQAADELLSVAGVRASFVIFPMGNQIRISARSLGEINVQLILERLGGGGHLTTAGCQITGSTPDKVFTLLTEAIDNYVAQA
ncbi:MAG: DHH family phosphoesterase [Clostridia bacterium]|nr:DHH family phosphoesterase [Clostridia bacterium]